MPPVKPFNEPKQPDVATSLNELGKAVTDAKAKADVVTTKKAALAKYVADKQAEIDAAQTEYDDAKVAAERLKESVRSLIGELLPAPDPRFRVTT